MSPRDPGLQPERTELAWRRTALALGVGGLVALRLLPVVFGDAWWALCGIGGLIASALTWLAGARRYRAVTRALSRMPDPPPLPGGGILAALTGLVVLTGLLAGVVVAVTALT